MATATIQQATPTKLRSGEWGARVHGRVRKGDVIRITARSGKTWTATVVKVVWSNREVSICATESSAPRRRGTWTGCACGSVEEFEKNGDCWTCQHDR